LSQQLDLRRRATSRWALPHISSYYYYFLTRGKPLVSQKLEEVIKSVWQWTLLWPVIIDKAIMQQNRVESLHRNGDIRWNKNEEDRTSPVVSASRLPNSLKN